MRIAALLLLLAAAGGAQEHPAHGHDFKDVEKWVQRFEDPARNEWQRPDLVVSWLGLRPGQVVADIGAGSGYFTRRFAQAVHPGGFALAVEIEPAFFPYIQKRAREGGQDNLLLLHAEPDDPHLEDQAFDLVFICNTVHHIEDRVSYYRKIAPALRAGGRLVIVDFFKEKELPVGPPPAMRLAPQTVTSELEEAGFRVEVNQTLLPYQYIVTAVPRAGK